MFRTLIATIATLASFMQGHIARTDSAHTWPLIKSTSWSGEIDLLGSPKLIPIEGADGQTLYRIYCASRFAPAEPQWLTQGDNYGGDFECLLTDSPPGRAAARATLLNYDPKDLSPYHFNLGSFSWQELLGQCRTDPEWGSDRTLYLRGMRIRIHVIDVKVGQYHDRKQGKTYPIIKHVTARIDVEPDRAATTSLARKPVKSEPSRCTR